MIAYGEPPPGSHGELVLAIRELRDSAGCPSLRKVSDDILKGFGRDSGVSHECFRQMLTGDVLPKWAKWSVVVRYLASSVGSPEHVSQEERRFRHLWIRARPLATGGVLAGGEGRESRPDAKADEDEFAAAPRSEESNGQRTRAAIYSRQLEEELGSLYAKAREEAERIRAEARAQAADILDRAGTEARDARSAPAAGADVGARHGVALMAVLALFGCLVGGVVGSLVRGVLASLDTNDLNGTVGPVAGLSVGLFTGAVIGSAGGAGLGRFFVVGEVLAGLVGCGGLIGLCVGIFTSSRPGDEPFAIFMACGVGAALGCTIGLIVYLCQLVRRFAVEPPYEGETAPLHITRISDGEGESHG